MGTATEVGIDDTLPTIEASIFRAYDVRGLVGENLSPEIVHAIGRAFGSELQERSDNHTVAVGRDGRASSAGFLDALAQGLCYSGVDVIDFGLVPTPLVHYGAFKHNAGAAIVVTGSHNPASYNGLKFAIGQLPFSGSQLTRLYDRITCGNLGSCRAGALQAQKVVDEYITEVAAQIKLAKPLRVVIDCGNGASGVLSRQLFEAIGCEVIVLYEEVDSTFPNHHPDPAVPANLTDLCKAVVELRADAGIAFDGDGDRVGIVTETGENVWADRLLALFARDVLERNPASTVVFDVKCGLSVREAVAENGGKSVVSPTGHTNIKQHVCQHDAVLGGEFSGHFCFPDRWYTIDDAAYAGTRFLELVSQGSNASELFSNIARLPATPEILIPVEDHRKFEIIEHLTRCASFNGGESDNTDGVRIDFTDGWGLVRASNTSPKLSLRFEAESELALTRIKQLFKHELERIAPDLALQGWL